ncbi:MAG TPA: two-component system response regulator [Verrucomicrobiales bacterium]|nr:two-component system response regulator [Verrucomicrobiales bacterium]
MTPPSAPPLRVLLVDDDTPFRTRLATALRARGCTVLECSGGEEALQTARSAELDGVIVDLRMPGIGGLECVTRLHELQAALRIIVLTGFGSIATAMSAVRAGASEYLIKPAETDAVLAAIRGEVNTKGGLGKQLPTDCPTLDRIEWEHIQRVLGECDGNISQTARLLGIDRRSLQRKLGKYPPKR